MPKITIPTKKRTWVTQNGVEFSTDISNAHGIEFETNRGYVTQGPALYPHTFQSDISGGFTIPTAYDFSENQLYIASNKILTGFSSISSKFVEDTAANAPTNLVNADLVYFGTSSYGSDKRWVVTSETAAYTLGLRSGYQTGEWYFNWITDSIGDAQIKLYTWNAGGSGYVNNDTFTVDNAVTGTTLATGKVLTVDGGGGVLTYLILTRGSGYSAAVPYVANTTKTSGAGTGFKINITAISPGGLGQTWTLALNTPHPMIVFGVGGVLFIGDRNSIHSIPFIVTQPSDVVHNRVIFPENYIITWMEATKEKIYIGLRHYTYAKNALIAEYDPFNESVRIIPSNFKNSIGFTHSDVLYVIDNLGVIWQNAGIYLQPYAEFPTLLKGTLTTLPHRNGIATDSKNSYILMPGDLAQEIDGGVWVLEMDTKSLYHGRSIVPTPTYTSFMGSKILNNVGCLGITSEIGAQGIISIKQFAGVDSFTNATTSAVSIVVDDNDYSTARPLNSYIVTGKIPSGEINTIWRNLLIKYSSKHRRATMTNGVIWADFMKDDGNNVESTFTGTWINATTFTFTGSTTGMNVGNKVDIIYGSACGHVAHIKTITVGAPNTIVLSETMSPVPTGTFKFQVTNWMAVGTETSNTLPYQIFDFQEPESEWIRALITFNGFLIDELQVGYEVNQIIEK